MRPRHLYAAIGLGFALGAAAPALAGTPGDPYEAFNRRIYASSSGADQRVLLPLANIYKALTPGPIGRALHNFFTNLSEPEQIANDILQARLKRAARDLVRLVANSTAGWGGLMDVAAPAGLPHVNNDFGVTLGVWGVRSGPYLFLPLLGPSTVRDAIGSGVDFILLDPLTYLRYPYRNAVTFTVNGLSGLDARERAQGDLDALLSGAADPYATLRSVYLQNREAMIRGESAAPALPPIDEPSQAPPDASGAPPSAEGPSGRQQAPGPATTAPGSQSLNDAPSALADPDAPIRTARLADIDGRAPTRLASNETP